MVKKGQNSVHVVIEYPPAGLIQLYFLNEPPIQTTSSEARSRNVMPSMATLRKSIPMKVRTGHTGRNGLKMFFKTIHLNHGLKAWLIRATTYYLETKPLDKQKIE